MRRMFSQKQIDEIASKYGVNFEPIVELGEIDVDAGTPNTASFESTIDLKDYDLFIFAMNGSFIITPLAQASESMKIALCCGSFAYDTLGNTMIARVRFTYATTPKTLTITFDESFADALVGTGITPSGYLFGIKLGGN